MVSSRVVPLSPHDQAPVANFVAERWGAGFVVSRGQVYHPHQLPGFIVRRGGAIVGLATYHLDAGTCQVVTLDSLLPGHGLGTALLQAVRAAALAAGCRRLWLITTNDNLPALRFYQKRGFRLVAVYPGALEQSRRLKPDIPLLGLDGIPLRDELELEWPLAESTFASL